MKSNASAVRLAATQTNQNLDFLASAGRHAAGGSSIVNADAVWSNNFQISVACVPHLDKIYSNLGQKIGRTSRDDMNDLDSNSLVRRMFMTATLDAAVHLGQDYLENVNSTKNQTQRTIRQLFDVTQKLITDRKEIQVMSKINWHTHLGQKTTLLTDKAVQLSTIKIDVFSDSVLCLGKMNPYPESIDAWTTIFNGLQVLLNIESWIESTGCQWKSIFPGTHCITDSRKDIGRFSGQDQKKKWYGSNTYKPNGEWDDVADHMLLNFSESGRPIFRGTRPLERRTLKK